MSIQLTVMSLDFDSSGAPSTSVYYKNEITVGRSKENDVVLDRPEVSDVHARLRVDPSGDDSGPVLFIMDMGSSNGTLVENNSLKSDIEVRMLPNERIIIGNYLIKPSIVEDAKQTSVLETEFEETDEDTLHTNGQYGTRMNNETEQVYDEAVNADSRTAVQYTVDVSGNETAEFLAEPEMAFAPPVERSPVGEEEVDWSEAQSASGVAIDVNTERYADVQSDEVLGENLSAIKVLIDGSAILDLDFEATELFSLQGTVLHKGSPLAGVTVSSEALDDTISSEDGSFRFSDIPDGTPFSLQAFKEGFLFDVSAASGVVTSDVVRSISATEILQVRGRVSHKGHGIAGVQVDGGELGVRETDEEGIFSFKNVPEFTRYSLRFAKDKFLFEPPAVDGTLEAGGPVEEVAARELFTVRGRVAHKGRPLEGVLVDGGPLGVVSTAGDGTYCFENVPEGEEYTIKVRKDKFQLAKST